MTYFPVGQMYSCVLIAFYKRGSTNSLSRNVDVTLNCFFLLLPSHHPLHINCGTDSN
jgi:hypothetical protein